MSVTRGEKYLDPDGDPGENIYCIVDAWDNKVRAVNIVTGVQPTGGLETPELAASYNVPTDWVLLDAEVVPAGSTLKLTNPGA